MDMKVRGSRSGKALGISEVLASACSASATLDPVDIDHRCHTNLGRTAVTGLEQR